MQPVGDEKRDHYRTSQEVLFDFKTVDTRSAEQGQAAAAFTDSRPAPMLEELRRLDKELQQLGSLLSAEQRLLGDYLHKLNSKIDVVARYSIFATESDSKVSVLSISEGGVSFICDRALYKGNFLALRIIFLPSYTPVVVFARVTRCDAQDGHHRVAAEFHRLKETDRQEIAKQVLRSQISERERAITSENTL